MPGEVLGFSVFPQHSPTQQTVRSSSRVDCINHATYEMGSESLIEIHEDFVLRACNTSAPKHTQLRIVVSG